MDRLTLPRNLLWVAVTWVLLALSPTQAADEIVYFHVDALGSATAAFNENGDLCWRQHYTPYGRQTSDQDARPPAGCGLTGKERGYTGHVQDESGLTYMQQRYYDASIGRFLSVDPMGVNVNDARTYNRYSYAANNPYKYVDPDGEAFFLAAIPLVIKALDLAVTAYDTRQAYNEGGAAGVAKSVATNAALNAVPGAKTFSSVASKLGSTKNIVGTAGKPERQTYYRYDKEEDFEKIQKSGELWGRPLKNNSGGGLTPYAKAYRSPKGAPGEGTVLWKFETDAPPDKDGHPGIPMWSGNRPGVRTEDGTAKLTCSNIERC